MSEPNLRERDLFVLTAAICELGVESTVAAIDADHVENLEARWSHEEMRARLSRMASLSR